jgi:Interferon regulatory factor transcription factor
MTSTKILILFESAGRYDAEKGEFKRWKANFRCALHSLDDVQEVKFSGSSNNGESFKVFELLDEKPRKSGLIFIVVPMKY